MRRAIDKLVRAGLLKTIHDEVDIELEMAHLAYLEAKKEHPQALLFTAPISRRQGKKFTTPVLMNLFGSKEATELLFGRSIESVASEIRELLHLKPPATLSDKLGMFARLFHLKSIFPKHLKKRGACQEIIWQDDQVDLTRLPILTTWPKDGGPFITMGQTYTQSLDGSMKNVGMYRLQLFGPRRLGLHWQIHKDSNHFFHAYKKAGQKMPVAIALGGDPLYTWCATAPMPLGIFELLLYGLITKKPVRMVPCLTVPLEVPEDADIVIEGWVDPEVFAIEGPFGDHTGYYTPQEPYPVLEVSALTMKEGAIYPATVVGKPPIEDKYMGWATERIFLPLLQTNAPQLLDYRMPENGVFHNLILAKIDPLYPGHAQQIMHAFWGVGQMSFVKHAIFVGPDAPDLTDNTAIAYYIANRLSPERLLITSGIIDALDHASPATLVGGKLGVDATGEVVEKKVKSISDEALLALMHERYQGIRGVRTYLADSANPITVIALDKHEPVSKLFEKLVPLAEYLAVVVVVDAHKNSLVYPYMLLWRVVNNIDALRDIKTTPFIAIDATDKGAIDGYIREWPEDTNCDRQTLEELKKRGLIDFDEQFLQQWGIVPPHN
ncbi:MAG: menaquinone biosynthesis decarboxylase [Campylobacterales bacterium]